MPELAFCSSATSSPSRASSNSWSPSRRRSTGSATSCVPPTTSCWPSTVTTSSRTSAAARDPTPTTKDSTAADSHKIGGGITEANFLELNKFYVDTGNIATRERIDSWASGTRVRRKRSRSPASTVLAAGHFVQPGGWALPHRRVSRTRLRSRRRSTVSICATPSPSTIRVSVVGRAATRRTHCSRRWRCARARAPVSLQLARQRVGVGARKRWARLLYQAPSTARTRCDLTATPHQS